MPSQHIAQEDPGPDDHALTLLASQQHKNLCGETHGQSSPTAQQELENRSQLSNYTSIEDTDDSEGEPAILTVQRISTSGLEPIMSPTLVIGLLMPENFKGRRGGKRTNIEPADAIEVEQGRRSLECFEPLEIRPRTDHDEDHSISGGAVYLLVHQHMFRSLNPMA
ncbi:uncharacterized protein PAC_15174 [Phialocephala subalpina]|uniref:Uncharacterized protein n=1 Tax=Phialocephala subalpina TaxID=576137 RepID=A0A1L7XJT9_9HELO|nr:uncharacterized protein PAC_15174 [Phialocephala subalpina]